MDPLTPADCDLRDFPFMPLDVVRLRDSDLAAEVTGDEFRAAVLLWCAAWHQVPAASLPDNDAVLAQLAGYGRVVREWQKVRDGALRGWETCSDGRLYHPVVAQKAREAWASKIEQRWRTECARIRKHNQRHGTSVEPPSLDEFTARGCRPVPLDTPAVSHGTKRAGHAGQSELSQPSPTGNALQGTGTGTGNDKKENTNQPSSPAPRTRERAPAREASPEPGHGGEALDPVLDRVLVAAGMALPGQELAPTKRAAQRAVLVGWLAGWPDGWDQDRIIGDGVLPVIAEMIRERPGEPTNSLSRFSARVATAAAKARAEADSGARVEAARESIGPDVGPNCDRIREQLRSEVEPATYDSWFASLRLVEGDGELVVEAPTPFSADWVRNHHEGALKLAARKVCGRPVAVRIDAHRAAA